MHTSWHIKLHVTFNLLVHVDLIKYRLVRVGTIYSLVHVGTVWFMLVWYVIGLVHVCLFFTG